MPHTQTSPTAQPRGKVALLPLGESLALQAQESQRAMAEAQAAQDKLAALQAASRFAARKREVRFAQSKIEANGEADDEDTVDHLRFDDDEDQEDYDWKQQGYYADG